MQRAPSTQASRSASERFEEDSDSEEDGPPEPLVQEDSDSEEDGESYGGTSTTNSNMGQLARVVPVRANP